MGITRCGVGILADDKHEPPITQWIQGPQTPEPPVATVFDIDCIEDELLRGGKLWLRKHRLPFAIHERSAKKIRLHLLVPPRLRVELDNRGQGLWLAAHPLLQEL